MSGNHTTWGPPYVPCISVGAGGGGGRAIMTILEDKGVFVLYPTGPNPKQPIASCTTFESAEAARRLLEL